MGGSSSEPTRVVASHWLSLLLSAARRLASDSQLLAHDHPYAAKQRDDAVQEFDDLVQGTLANACIGLAFKLLQAAIGNRELVVDLALRTLRTSSLTAICASARASRCARRAVDTSADSASLGDPALRA